MIQLLLFKFFDRVLIIFHDMISIGDLIMGEKDKGKKDVKTKPTLTAKEKKAKKLEKKNK